MSFYLIIFIFKRFFNNMLARLWMRQASAGSVLSGNATLAAAGVQVTEVSRKIDTLYSFRELK